MENKLKSRSEIECFATLPKYVKLNVYRQAKPVSNRMCLSFLYLAVHILSDTAKTIKPSAKTEISSSTL